MRFSLLGATKRGSLSLSTNAIVTIVLAFVMLGLGLSIIRTLGSNTSDAIPKALSLADLEQKPTPDNTLTVPKILKIKNSGESSSLNIGWYNANIDSYYDVVLGISACLNPNAVLPAPADIDPLSLPIVTTLKQEVPSSTSAAFNVVVKKSKTGSTIMSTGQYLCEFVVRGSLTSGGPLLPGPVDKTQVTVQITS